MPLDHLPGPGDRRHRGRDIPPGRALRLAELTGGDAADDRGRRPPRPRPAPGRRQPRDQGVRRPDRAAPAARHAVAVRPRAAAHRAVGLLADRARATCCATSRSPGPCASGCRTCGSSGWRSRRSRRCWPRPARSSTRPAPSSPRRSEHWEGEAGRPRPARVPRVPQHRRDLLRQLPALRRGGPGHAVRPVGGRRVVGGRPLPAREPRAQDRAVRLHHGRRRVPAGRRTATRARRS